jgi:hypothetical protein
LDTDEHIRLELVKEVLKALKSDNSFIYKELLNVPKDHQGIYLEEEKKNHA